MFKRPFLLLTCLLTCAALLGARYELKPAPESYVEYRAADPRGSWQGRAPLALSLRFDDALEEISLTAAVEPGAFDSGNFIRDANARLTVFETQRYPEASFEATGLRAEVDSLGDGETRVMLTGPLTLHGVTRKITFPAQVTRSGETFQATGSFSVKLSDFEMTRPTLFGVAVFNRVEVFFNVQGKLEVGVGD